MVTGQKSASLPVPRTGRRLPRRVPRRSAGPRCAPLSPVGRIKTCSRHGSRGPTVPPGWIAAPDSFGHRRARRARRRATSSSPNPSA